ncbi:YetF domain-containing protein [Sulfitobacter sp. HNIBRBA2951]|uniref:DUF421 domain-containing protein n=1 Tax=Sulfitobacter aquimarinus TaxID=3158557 RepID=UPI0032DFE13A
MIFEYSTHPGIWRGAVLAPLALAWVIFLVRVVGLRAFSKMTGFDFVVTVATGSLLAGAAQATDWNGFVQSCAAVTALLGVQLALAFARRRFIAVSALIDNEPVLIMENGVILDAALAHTRVARSDLLAKLREANALNPNSVKSAVLETTGDVSVLHGDDVDPILLEGVRRI